MPSNHTVASEDLTEGRNIHIRGKLAYARLTRLIEGQELVLSDQRKIQNGMYAVEAPHTTATITHAEVLFADPSNPTLEEQFVSERRFDSTKRPETGKNYSIDSKSSKLPTIAVPSAKGDGTLDQDTSGRELAQGLDVTLVLTTYKPKRYNKRGLRLDYVIVNEAPQYYSAGGASTDELAARGIVFNAPPKSVDASEANPVGDAAPVPTEVDSGLPFPGPQPQGQVQVQAAPAPAPQVQAQPAQPVQPVQQTGETPEQKIARLEAENAQLKDAGSAVGAPAQPQSIWDDTSGQAQQPGITYQG